MHFVRTLHIKKYDPGKRRFQSDCFKAFGDGISVFEYACSLITTPNGVCDHIARFYPSTVGDPTAYWIIDSDHLVEFYNAKGINVSWEQTDSTEGDKCHYDIYGIDKKQGKPYVEGFCRTPNIHICVDGESKRILSDEDHQLMAELYLNSMSPPIPPLDKD